MDVAAITTGLGVMALESCGSCGKSSDDLKKCSACKTTWYCDEKCQKAHRQLHRKECRRIAKGHNANPLRSVSNRAFLRSLRHCLELCKEIREIAQQLDSAEH